MTEVEIDAFPPQAIAAEMGLAYSTFRAITQRIRAANIPGFDYEPYNPVPISSVEIFRLVHREKQKKFTWQKAIDRTKTQIFTQLLEELNDA